MSVVNVNRDAAGEIRHGHQTVGPSAAKLTSEPIDAPKGVILKAPSSNSNSVWVGGAAVTADSNADTGGLEIEPGEPPVHIPIDDPSKLYGVSDAASQDIAWFAAK